MGHPLIYSREYYRQIAELEDRHWWHVGMREVAASLLHSELRNGRYLRVLDAGCGTGGNMKWIREILRSDQVVGVDIAREALDFCGSDAAQILSQATVLQLPFRSGSFDFLLSQDVVQHLPTDGSDLRALAEMHRVLRPGGLLLLRANSRLGMWQDGRSRDANFQRYTLPEIVALMRNAGFVVIRATYANAVPALYAAAKRFALRARRGGRHHRLYEGLNVRDTPARNFWLNWLLLWVLKAEAFYLSVIKGGLAFGHSTLCLARKPLGGDFGRPREVEPMAVDR